MVIPVRRSQRFAAAEAAAEACGWREPAVLWWRADFAEVLLELGRVGDAVELLDAWEPDARRLGRDRILAHITRCRGLVAAARGDIERRLRRSSGRSTRWTRRRIRSATPVRSWHWA